MTLELMILVKVVFWISDFEIAVLMAVTTLN